jgi:hypothetical protein
LKKITDYIELLSWIKSPPFGGLFIQ